jgi:hypothetical protein
LIHGAENFPPAFLLISQTFAAIASLAIHAPHPNLPAFLVSAQIIRKPVPTFRFALGGEGDSPASRLSSLPPQVQSEKRAAVSPPSRFGEFDDMNAGGQDFPCHLASGLRNY